MVKCKFNQYLIKSRGAIAMFLRREVQEGKSAPLKFAGQKHCVRSVLKIIVGLVVVVAVFCFYWHPKEQLIKLKTK